MDEKHTTQNVEYNVDEKDVGLRASPDIEEKEDLRTVDAGVSADQAQLRFDKMEARRILRKIDYRLIPLLTILYLLAFIDRSNIGNAKIAGMYEDLKLYGTRYNTALTVFFVPYALLEVPSNIVLKMIRPSIWISMICFCWGLVMTLMGLTSSYRGLVAARFFLGANEAGFFPAATYLLTIWYQRYEVQRRTALFYAAAWLSGAFSGLLAFAIEKMGGIGGLGGWQWIFVLEGLLPVTVSLTLYFLLPDKPETAKFLTKEEREFIVNRIALHTGSGHGRVTNSDKIGMAHIKAAFSEWKVCPSVIREMGYSSANAQLMTIPFYAVATLATVGVAFWSDYIQQRTPLLMGGFSIAVVGFIAQLAIPHPQYTGVSYFFLFLVAVGLYCPFTCVVTLVANNLAPSSKRAVGMALLISVGNMGGICGSNIYYAAQAPRYQTGFGVCLAVCVAGIIAAFILRKAYQAENRRRDELLAREGEDAIKAKYTDQELLDMGDRSPFYRYTL